MPQGRVGLLVPNMRDELGVLRLGQQDPKTVRDIFLFEVAITPAGLGSDRHDMADGPELGSLSGRMQARHHVGVDLADLSARVESPEHYERVAVGERVARAELYEGLTWRARRRLARFASRGGAHGLVALSRRRLHLGTGTNCAGLLGRRSGNREARGNR